MYKNPIIFCDYSDPDVIKVGDIYYLVASSFNFTPGLPILASSNLVEWKLINYAVENIPAEKYEYPQNAKGIWAPSFSYHNGKFYIIVGLPDDGIYITESADPFSKWSPLKQIWSGKGYIDPFLLWDDDGKAYVIHAYAKSRCGFNSKVGLIEFDTENLCCVGEDQIIFDGTKIQPTIEGPKVYKRNGYYYIFAPAGGVSEGWQAVLRSKSIYGPYEDKIVLEEGNTGINGPHQGALVETDDGKNWFIHFQESGIYGRITHLQPVVWQDDWPLIGTATYSNNKNEIGNPVLKHASPKCKNLSKKIKLKSPIAAFENANLEWQWSGNHSNLFARNVGIPNQDIESFSLAVMNKTLHYKDGKAILWNSSNVLTRKIKYEQFYYSCKMNIENLPEGGRTGLIFQGEEYASVAIERTKNGIDLIYLNSVNSEFTDDERDEVILKRITIATENIPSEIRFRMDFYPVSIYSGCVFFSVKAGYFFNKFSWKSDYFYTENAHWVGGRFGVYAIGEKTGNVLVYDSKVRH